MHFRHRNEGRASVSYVATAAIVMVLVVALAVVVADLVGSATVQRAVEPSSTPARPSPKSPPARRLRAAPRSSS